MTVIDLHLAADDLRSALARDVRAGLSAPQKRLEPVYFYDDRGSVLFDEITRLPEYYLTRAERRLLEEHAYDIAQSSNARVLVELGAGTCGKTRILLDAMTKLGSLRTFVPLDVSDATLRSSASKLQSEYPGLEISAIVGDYQEHLREISGAGTGSRLVAFLGSTIGNLSKERRGRFLFDLDCAMTKNDSFLLGADRVKDRTRLLAAYDDAAGITAEFNRNVLVVLNRELGADFRPELFEHVAVFNEIDSCIEMRLRSKVEQVVDIPGLHMNVTFGAGEELLTETSAKFSPEGLVTELWSAGFVTNALWEDEEGFLLALAAPYC